MKRSEKKKRKVGYLQGPFGYCMAITILVALFLLFRITIISYCRNYDNDICGYRRIIFVSDSENVINIKFVESKRTVEGSLFSLR